MSARDLLRQRVAALVDGGMTRAAAVQQATRSDPDLHRRVLDEANPGVEPPGYLLRTALFKDKERSR